MNRKMTIALSVSLALNLFLGGFVVARAVHRSHRHASGGPIMGPGGLMRDGEMPEQARTVMRRHRPALREHRKGLRAAGREVHAALAQEPFEPRRLKQALAKTRKYTGQSQAALHEALVEVASKVGPKHRKKLGRAAMAGHPQRPSRGHRGKHGHRGRRGPGGPDGGPRQGPPMR